ncbi:hypothetical protein BGX27_004308 [Mortierella sp. AM989]|nr:hypothetical protein BGX27_004308 [Mortierella sp. AM989]
MLPFILAITAINTELGLLRLGGVIISRVHIFDRLAVVLDYGWTDYIFDFVPEPKKSIKTQQSRLFRHLLQSHSYPYWDFFGSISILDHATDVIYNQKRPTKKLDIYIPNVTLDENTYLYQGKNDLHRPRKNALQPVIVFIYGGAWSSGSKLIYTLVGARLRSMGYLVMIPDYSIFPAGKTREMEQDVKMAIQWTYKNCRDFGGDPQQLYLMGHSAGAHLCALTVLDDSIQRVPTSLFGSSRSAISSSPILTTLLDESIDRDKNDMLPRLRGMILCSGVYDIGEHYKHETSRGVEQISAMGRVMGNSEETFRLYSPTNILQELLQVSTRIDRNYPTESQTRHQNLLRHLKSLLPIETLMIHGDKDQTVPWKSSSEFYMELKTLQLGSNVRMRVLTGMAHEEPVVALMPTFGRNAPFRQPLMDEISHFIDGDKSIKTSYRE